MTERQRTPVKVRINHTDFGFLVKASTRDISQVSDLAATIEDIARELRQTLLAAFEDHLNFQVTSDGDIKARVDHDDHGDYAVKANLRVSYRYGSAISEYAQKEEAA